MLAVAYVGSFSAVLCMLMTSCCCRPQLLAFSMLDICYKFGVENDIIFNQKKSVCIRIGPHWNRPISPMVLGNISLDWVSSFKYLGINFFSGLLLKVDICCIKRSFYKAINGILSYCKTADEFVTLGLVKAYCLPLLTYCIGAIDLPASSVNDLAVCWNDCFRKNWIQMI